MLARLILQGFRDETHVAALQRLLRLPDTERAILSVAYLNLAGVDLIAADLSLLADRAWVFAGIRNGITSHQALRRLLLTGARLVVVDTGAYGVTYHPKLYFAKSATAARLLIGSANLTIGGLNNNIEASLEVELDLAARADQTLQQATEEQFIGLQEAYPQHVSDITTADAIDHLLETGRLVDEKAVLRTIRLPSVGTDTVPRIPLAVQPIHPPTVSAQPRPRGRAAQPTFELWEQVWESKPLTERDLGIPTGATTNRTGSINLDKGHLSQATDHRHYFRTTVFNALAWVPGRPGIEEATARFTLVVKGVYCGEFALTLSHTTSTTSRAYLQRNAMTRLRWGRTRAHVAHRHLLRRSLELFRERANPTRFMIEID